MTAPDEAASPEGARRSQARLIAVSLLVGLALGTAIVVLGVLLWQSSGEDSPEDAALRKRLRATRITMSLSGAPLDDAVAFIRDVTSVNVVVTPAARLEASGRPLSLAGKETSLEEALEQIVARAGVRYELEHGLVWIVHPKEELISRVDLSNASPDARNTVTNNRVTLNFDGTPAEDMVQFISDITGLTVEVDPAFASGDAAMTLRLTDVSLRTALEVAASQVLDARFVARGRTLTLEADDR